jgi:hypothetical protein
MDVIRSAALATPAAFSVRANKRTTTTLGILGVDRFR